MNPAIARAERTAAIAAGVTAALAGVKLIVGITTGADVLVVDAVHSGADLLALAASWFGLRLAGRPADAKFPYGYFRAETLATLLVAVVILYMGVNLFLEGLDALSSSEQVTDVFLAVGTGILSLCTALVLALWEKRVSKATGSQSLAATADEAMMDMVSSTVVVVALAAWLFSESHLAGIINGAATMLVSLAVLRVGVQHGWIALLSLMDASIDPELEQRVNDILLETQGVRAVRRIRARRSGPFYFVEGHVLVSRGMDVSRSHALSHSAGQRIREKMPRIEGVMLHVEPYLAPRRRVLIPVDSGSPGVDSRDMQVSEHFGRAPVFVVASIEDGQIIEITTVENPFREKKVRAGLAAVNRFIADQDIDIVLLREIGEIAFHALRDNYVSVYTVSCDVVSNVLDQYVTGKLVLANEPTHSSEHDS